MMRSLHRPSLVLAAALLFVLSCERKPEPTPPPVVAPVGTTPSPEKEPPVEYHGGPVAVAEPEVLHERGELRVERQRWRSDGVDGVAWRVRVPLSVTVEIPASDTVAAFTSLLPAGSGPWAAINGGFYEAAGDMYRPMGLVVSGGDEVSSITHRGGSGIFYVDEEGRPAIAHRADFDASPSVAVQSIDRIVADGESVVTRKPGATGAARSAVVVGDQHFWLIIAVAEGDIQPRPGGALLRRTRTGLSLWAFAEYVLATTDAEDALNLDGGISTQLAVRDGDYQLLIEGVRGTMNAVVVRPE